MTVGAVVENKAALDMAQSALEVYRECDRLRVVHALSRRFYCGEETGRSVSIPEEQ